MGSDSVIRRCSFNVRITRKRTSARHYGMSHELPRRHSRKAVLLNVGLEDHSGLMPANLITFAHFSVSSVMSFPKSWGEPASTVLPRSGNRAEIVDDLGARTWVTETKADKARSGSRLNRRNIPKPHDIQKIARSVLMCARRSDERELFQPRQLVDHPLDHA